VSVPLEDDGEGLSDALAARALARVVTGAAAAGFALGLLALVFVLLADGRLDATSLPQVLVLGTGQVVGLVVASAAATRLRAVRAVPGTGPGHASGAARTAGRAVVVASVVGVVLAVGSIVVLTPRSASAFSAVLGLALLSQLALVLHVLRRALVRAARRPADRPG